MDLDPTIGAVLMLLVGLVVAMAGHWLFKTFAGLAGAILLGAGSFLMGLWIGGLFGGTLGLLIAIAMGIIGAVIGAVLAIAAATVILAVGSGILAFSVTAMVGEGVGLSDAWAALIGIAAAIISTVVFLVLARTMIRAASAVLGGFLAASGTFYLIDRTTSIGEGMAFPASLVAFITVASVGFIVQSRSDDDRRRKAARKRSRDSDRGRRSRRAKPGR
jgi:hypothetical protein